MAKEKKNLREQEAPLKNTDNAFVKVGKDGAPVMPERQEEDKHEQNNKEKTEGLNDHR